MLNVKPFRQSSGLCGPASLKMVLDYFGTKRSEKELADLAGATTHSGVDSKGLLKAAKELGFRGIVKDFSDIKDLELYILNKNIPVIVDWFSTDDGHYSVVVDLDKENVYLQDPELGGLRTIDRQTFKRVWFDFSGDFLKSKDDIIIRRMIIIYR
ncbi:MAG: C39 family peptidase [Candidatus Levybacteria bacterium]|nr:C39 family peptidase [Candidatus Levybacteria bacterium]